MPNGQEVEKVSTRGNTRDHRVLRRVVAATVVTAVILLFFGAFEFLAVWASPFDASVRTNDSCRSTATCEPPIEYVSAGGDNSREITGYWNTTATPDSIILEIGIGPVPSRGCVLCQGVVYSSPPGSTNGSFTVHGTGPFYIVIAPLLPGNATTFVDATVYSTTI